MDYRATTPDSNWTLFGRAVGQGGLTSGWVSYAVRTPKRPKLVILGDSVSSGHHKDSDTANTKCEDANYGYAPAFFAKWKANLPSVWASGVTYSNYAKSGFATQKRSIDVKSSVLEGGLTACQSNITTPPISQAVATLKGNPGTWNRVVISAGVNDTNWGDVAKSVVSFEIAKEIDPTNISRSPLTEDECGAIIASQWNGTSQTVTSSMSQGIARIVAGLHTADPGAAITWLGYYNMAGTGGNLVHPNPYMPTTCQNPVRQSLDELNGTIQAALPGDVQMVPTDIAIGTRSDYIQPLYAIAAWLNGKDGKNPPGWPHPNQTGGQQIANLIPAS